MGGELAQEQEWSHDRELDWWLLQHPAHLGVRTLVGDLNRLQADTPALWAGDDDLDGNFWWLDADDRDQSVFAFGRRIPEGHPSRGPAAGQPEPAEVVVVVANLTPVPRPGYRLGVPFEGDWRVLLDTDARRYGGSGHELVPDGGAVLAADVDTPWQGQPFSLRLTLPPLAVVALSI